MHVCMYACMYVRMCVCMYIYIYIDHNVWIRGMEQRYGTDPSNRYGRYGTGIWNGCGPGPCSGPSILTCTHIYIYICGRIVQTVPYLCIYHYISIIY